jgi:ParB-like chromosome segregation protein Spo0J
MSKSRANSDKNKPITKKLPEVTLAGRTFTILFPELLRPLNPAERQRLKDSIAANGVQYPVLVDEEDGVIDGGHRLQIAAELDLDELWVEALTGLTWEQKQKKAKSLNIDRRQLTRQEIDAAIKAKLIAEPERSNNSIAKEVGASDKTVATRREQLESDSEIPKQTERITSDGKTRPAHQARPRQAIDPFLRWTTLFNRLQEGAAEIEASLGSPDKIALDLKVNLRRGIVSYLDDIIQLAQRWKKAMQHD